MIGRMFPPTSRQPEACQTAWSDLSPRLGGKAPSRRNLSLPQYATGISSRPRQLAFLHKPPTEAYSARHSIVLDTPPEQASGVRYPTFPSKLPQASRTRYQFSSMRHHTCNSIV